MLRRGLYKALTGEVVWLLYELDGYVHVQNRATGAVEKHHVSLFTMFYVWHSAEVA